MMPLSQETEQILKNAVLEARQHNTRTIDAEHVLLALLHDKESKVAQILHAYQLS